MLALDPATGELRQREYELSVLAGPDQGLSLRVGAPLVVGNDPGAGLVLTDPTVSRAHLRLVPRADGMHVEDLRSTNGTFVSGSRVTELTVERATELRLGKTVLGVRPVDTSLRTPESLPALDRLESESPLMQRLFGLAQRAAHSGSACLITGESGTGKEALARAMHAVSPRAGRPLVVVDCGALVPALMDSELFGHARGAFTGATEDRVGAFVRASGGTLLLDEVGELPWELQPKLLRVLDTRTVKPLGKNTTTQVDVRVIAMTHRDLEAEVAAGRFRQDLFYRLAVLTLRVPPLREHLEDLPLLTRRFEAEAGGEGLMLSFTELERLRAHAWPGNLRELRNVVTAAVAGVRVAPDAQPRPSRPALPVDPQLPYKEAKELLVADFTRAYLAALADACGGNLSEMARRAQIARHHMRALLERHGLRSE